MIFFNYYILIQETNSNLHLIIIPLKKSKSHSIVFEYFQMVLFIVNISYLETLSLPRGSLQYIKLCLTVTIVREYVTAQGHSSNLFDKLCYQ